MKSLAEYIMRGRAQAMIVATLAMLSMFFAWVGAAVVALVVLRLGMSAAISVILAALMPAVMWASAGDIGPITTLICTTALAGVLRSTRSWPAVMLIAPCLLGCWGLMVLVLAPDYVLQMQAIAEQLIINFKEQLLLSTTNDAEIEAIGKIQPPSGTQLIGMFAVLQALSVMVSLFLARWWQALLYNPGGFQQEFHQLRLTRVVVILLVMGFVLTWQIEAYKQWSMLFALMLVIAGTALVHGLAGITKLRGHWLVIFYMMLFMIKPLMPIVMIVVVADCVLDFRSQLRNKLG